MSYQAIEFVRKNCAATGSMLAVMMMIAHHADTTGRVTFPLTVDALAADVNVSVRQLERVLLELEDLHGLEMGHKRGRGQLRTFRIVMVATTENMTSVTGIPDENMTSVTGIPDEKHDIQRAENMTSSAIKHDIQRAHIGNRTTDRTTDRKANNQSTSSPGIPPPKTDDDDFAASPERFEVLRAPALHPRTFTEKQLREVAAALGDGFGFRGDWPGFGAWLDDLDVWTLEGVIVLLFHYGHQSQANMDRITNMPGLIRRLVERGRFVTLAGREARLLGQEIDRILILNELNEIAPPVDDEAYKRKTSAWVEPKNHDPTYQPLSKLLGVHR